MNGMRYKLKLMGLMAGVALTSAATAWAQDAVAAVAAPAAAAVAVAPAAAVVNSGDTAWVLISTALVLLMTIPGLALFYCGLVRRKNVLSVLMQCFFLVCMITLQWVMFGYSLSFGPDIKGFIGSLDWAMLNHVGAEPNADYAGTIPHSVFMLFQMMFAIITPALIVGAFAERMKFAAFALFSLLWATIVYDPLAHWVWGMGGFLRKMGALDFAGGTVVHINAGVAALVCALVLGRRLGYPKKLSPPHNLPFAVVGAGLLWFGWFGFNAGSSLAANGLAGSAFLATHVATAAAGLAWAVMDLIKNRHVTVLGVISGAVAGLVAITPAAGFVTAGGAIAIGVGAGVICYLFVTVVKPLLGYDDALDAFGVHGVGGIWGALATGLFATTAVNSAGANGLFYGNPALLWIQFKAVMVTVVYSGVMSYVLLKLVDAVLGLRASEQAERIGLDLTDHRETGYTLLD
jgi:Amt family ammonium transporter